MTDQKTAPTQKFFSLIKALPKTHIALASAAIASVFFTMMLPSEVQANRRPLPLPAELSTDPQLALTAIANPTFAEPALIAQEPSDNGWQELVVRKGDNLAKLFDRAGLSAADMNDVLQSGPEGKLLRHIFPGQKLAFQTNEDGQLIALRYEETQLKSTQYLREEDNFVAEKIHREPEVRQQFISGDITSSFYKAGLDAGLSDSQILQLADIFGGEIDFVLDLRSNDRFLVMFDEYHLDGKKVGNGPIRAASFTNQGQTYQAFRYVYANGDVGYFSQDGTSMRKTFMRAPLDVLKVSSPFSMKRVHPLFKTSRPHRGIDYSAPTGTPIYAAGDGRIVQSGFSSSMGNYVVIEHNKTYSTKYMHMQKRAVAAGQRVKQHQVIGYVGATGYATGPHLHYEFLVNGVHTNPAKIASKLPKADRIAAGEQRRFMEQVRGLQSQFAAYASQTESKVAAAPEAPEADATRKTL